MNAARTVVVLVGTDHHPFDRAVAWADQWATDHPQDKVVIQHGSTAGPTVASGMPFMANADLRDLVRGATIVISHGGPGTIMDVRASGHHPVVLARNPELGEHVDDHQMRFAQWAQAKGLALAVTSTEELTATLNGLGPEGTRMEGVQADDTVQTAEHLVDLLGRLRAGGRVVTNEATAVLQIAGLRPATSPLLETLVGRRGVAVLGDVSALWRTTQPSCSCGSALDECSFWSAVGRRLGGWQGVRALGGLHDQLTEPRLAVRLMLPGTPRPVRELVVAYAEGVRAVLAAAAAEAGAALVVDCSASGDDALALSHSRGLDLRVLDAGSGPAGARFGLRRRALRRRSVTTTDLGAPAGRSDSATALVLAWPRLGLGALPERDRSATEQHLLGFPVGSGTVPEAVLAAAATAEAGR